MRENLNDGITVNMLGLRLVMGNVVLSLWSKSGDSFTRGLNEVRRKLNGGALRNTGPYAMLKIQRLIGYFMHKKSTLAAYKWRTQQLTICFEPYKKLRVLLGSR